MNISVNGQTVSISPNTTLESVITRLALKNQRFAVEVNGEIVTRSTYPHFLINDGDRVEIVVAVGGG